MVNELATISVHVKHKFDYPKNSNNVTTRTDEKAGICLRAPSRHTYSSSTRLNYSFLQSKTIFLLTERHVVMSRASSFLRVRYAEYLTAKNDILWKIFDCDSTNVLLVQNALRNSRPKSIPQSYAILPLHFIGPFPHTYL